MCFRFRLEFDIYVFISRSRRGSCVRFKPHRCTETDPRGAPELPGRLEGSSLRPPAGLSPDLVRPTEVQDIAARLLAVVALSLPILPATPPVLTGVTGIFLRAGSAARPGDMGVRGGAGATGPSPGLLCRFTR